MVPGKLTLQQCTATASATIGDSVLYKGVDSKGTVLFAAQAGAGYDVALAATMEVPLEEGDMLYADSNGSYVVCYFG